MSEQEIMKSEKEIRLRKEGEKIKTILEVVKKLNELGAVFKFTIDDIIYDNYGYLYHGVEHYYWELENYLRSVEKELVEEIERRLVKRKVIKN